MLACCTSVFAYYCFHRDEEVCFVSKDNFLFPFLFAFLTATFSLSNRIVFEEAEGGILLRYLKTISFAVFGYCSSSKKTGPLCKHE